MKTRIKNILFSILDMFTSWKWKDIRRRIADGVYSAHVKRFAKNSGSILCLANDSSLSGLESIQFGNNFHSYSRLRLDAISNYNGISHSPSIVFGKDVIIQCDCHITAIDSIEIGNSVLIASKVLISDHSHGRLDDKDLVVAPVLRELYSKGPIRIEDNVWIGEGVTILPGVTIGANAIIGANSVVTKDIPSNAIAVGAPARVIRIIGGKRT